VDASDDHSNSRYRDQAHYHITHKRRQAFYALPQKHWQMLSAAPFNMLSNLDRIDEAIERNAEIAEEFVASGVAMYDLSPPLTRTGYSHAQSGDQHAQTAIAEWEGPVNPTDQEKAHSTVKQLYRDWGAEGAVERRACYDPVLTALDEEYKHIPRSQRGMIKVLVPGAGLGRFVFEVNRAGYAVEGNEISYHQIIASNYILNFTTQAEQFELYPWIHGFSNHLSRQDQLQKVLVPDIHPATELQKVAADSEKHTFERMSFSSADFCVAYKEADSHESFHAVTSIFFIDTAPNVIKYIEAVYHCLKKGGIWVNLGPLKWHFENSPHGDTDVKNKGRASSVITADDGIGDPGSVELTEDEVVALVAEMGFTIEKHETMQISTGYIGNPKSMSQGIYHPSFWVARKR
jgi:carnosine N-methyltransferase